MNESSSRVRCRHDAQVRRLFSWDRQRQAKGVVEHLRRPSGLSNDTSTCRAGPAARRAGAPRHERATIARIREAGLHRRREEREAAVGALRGGGFGPTGASDGHRPAPTVAGIRQAEGLSSCEGLAVRSRRYAARRDGFDDPRHLADRPRNASRQLRGCSAARPIRRCAAWPDAAEDLFLRNDLRQGVGKEDQQVDSAGRRRWTHRRVARQRIEHPAEDPAAEAERADEEGEPPGCPHGARFIAPCQHHRGTNRPRSGQPPRRTPSSVPSAGEP